MLLVNSNFYFVQRAQVDPTWTGIVKYEIGGRITSLGTALLLLAEAVGRASLAILAGLAYIVTVGGWEKALSYSAMEWKDAKTAGSVSLSFFLSVLSPKSLANHLLNGPLSGLVRENRMQFGAELIQQKLEKEKRLAQNQMLQEIDGENFRYLVGNLGESGAEKVGGCDVGFCHYIGRRPTMEDEHLATTFELQINGKNYPVKLFGIFDGHGGPEASKFLKEHLKDKLHKTLLEMCVDGLSDENIWNALKITLVRLDQEFKGESGSTATMAMVLDGKLWTANVGDSRIILDNRGEIFQLTEDANPTDERYEKGIKNRGGAVYWNMGMRVNGAIAVARAIGDHFVNGALSARPKITMTPLDKIRRGSHLILACDGIYDVASSRQIGFAVRDHAHNPPETLARNIVHSAFEAQSGDNLSAMIINLVPRHISL